MTRGGNDEKALIASRHIAPSMNDLVPAADSELTEADDDRARAISKAVLEYPSTWSGWW